MADLPEPELDTACFSDKQWFVNGVPFTTKGDAKNAIRLAGQHASECQSELAERVRNYLRNY